MATTISIKVCTYVNCNPISYDCNIYSSNVLLSTCTKVVNSGHFCILFCGCDTKIHIYNNNTSATYISDQKISDLIKNINIGKKS